MGTIFSETFDNGTPGTNITTAETVFDTITGTPKYSADTAHGNGSMRVTVADGEASYGEIAGPSANEIYVRFYVKPLELPTYGFYLMNIKNGSKNVAFLSVGYKGKLQMSNEVIGAVGPPSPIGLVVNQWTRIEWHVTETTQQLRMFQGADLESDTPTWDSGPAAWSGSALTGAKIGQVLASKAVSLLIDDYAASDENWLGPAGPQAPQPTGYLLTETGWVPFTHRIVT